MKTKPILFVLLALSCFFSVSAQTGAELLTTTNFGTTEDGTGVNTTNLYVLPTWITPPDSVYSQPPTRVYYNNWNTGSNNPPPETISINSAVTIAPPLPSTQTAYTFGFNETWYANYYTFLGKNGNNSGVQIPMAPNNGNYVIATSTQGMYNAPTLTASSAVWYVIYDRYEVNQAHPSNYFLVVNADPNPGKIFYQQNVTVTPGHIYRMSSDLARLNTGNDPGSAPNVAFNINGDHVFDTSPITIGGKWITYSFDYVAPCGVSTIPIAFTNNTSNTNGNDLALDNLSFKEILPQITMTASSDCDAIVPPVTFVLSAEIDVETPGSYTINWYKVGSATSIKTSNLGTDKTYSVDSSTADYAAEYYYTVTLTTNSGCPLTSPVVTIPDISETCNIPKINPDFDRISATPGVTTDPYNIMDNDCTDGSSCSTGDLQILYFTIAAGNNIDPSAGVYQPGVPVMITDNQNRTVGVLMLDRAGNLAFQEAPDYPSVDNGGIADVHFNYTIVDVITGATGETYVDIALTQLDYTVEASCSGYPVRIVFDIEAFFPNDFTYPSDYSPNPDGTVPVGEIDAPYADYINDAVATRFYLVNANTGVTISDEAVKNGASNITRIDVVRTNELTDGGKLIFEFMATTPGIMSVQLRKKDIYADTSTGDPIMQKFVVQICPKAATWVGLSSSEWQENNNWISEGLGAYPTWCTDVEIPNSVAVVTKDGSSEVDMIKNFPILIPGDACKDIVFHMGASVGGIQNLIYRAAYVEYQPPAINSFEYAGKWTMITAPLKYIYSADFQPSPSWDFTNYNAFSEIKSYMSYFDLAYEAGAANPDGVTGAAFGSFSRPFANLKQQLTAGLGFASNVILTGGGGTTFTRTDISGHGNSTFYFPRYHLFANMKLFEGLGSSYEGVSSPNYQEADYAYHWRDTGEWIPVDQFTFAPNNQRGTVGTKSPDSQVVSGYPQPWNPNFYTTITATYPPPFDYYSEPAVSYVSSLPNPLVGQDSRFRFIYEDTAFGYDSTGAFTITLPGTGNTRIVGNPFMSHLDFDEFYTENSSSIQPYYRLWDGSVFTTYTATGFSDTPVWEGMDGLSSSTDPDATLPVYRYVPPMQAIFVDAQNEGSLSLNFNTAMSTSIPNVNVVANIGSLLLPVNNQLRTRNAANENLLKLRLKMKGVETVALLASLPNATDGYNRNEDIYKLFSYDKATPEIYTVASNTAIEINAVSQAGGQKLIPLGIKTDQTGQFEIKIEGADDFAAYEYVQLRDALEGKYYDLKETTSFTFSKTSSENLEGRFYIHLSNLIGGEEPEKPEAENGITFVRENGSIRIYSPIEPLESFEAYDTLGRLYFQNTQINDSSYLWNPKALKGIFLLKAKTSKRQKVQKIIL